MQLRPAFLTAALTSVAMVAVGTYGVTTSATPYELIANSTALEAEALAVTPAPNGSIYTDSTASGGKALGLWANATAYATVTQPASTKVVVRAKAQKCQGQPTMVVTVDGVTIGSTTISATSWTDYATTANIGAGSHVVGIAYTNDYRSLFCDRNLLVDKVTIVPGAVATTPPTTTPPTGTVALGAVVPYSAVDVSNPKRGQFENIGVGLFPQSQPAQRSYPAWPDTFDAGARFEWKDLQPTSAATINYAPIDAAIAAAAARGKRFHFRVMAFASCCQASYPANTDISVPDWLRATTGATTDYVHNGITYVVPNWNNDAYLSAVERLIAALGTRYNKDERVAWFELSGYGDFSENHNAFMRDTLGVSGPAPADSVAALGYYSQYQDQYITKSSVARIVNATLRAFPDTQVLTTAQNPEIVKQVMRDSPAVRGLAHPVGVRADCLGVYQPPQTWAVNQYSYYVQSGDPIVPMLLDRWRTAPVVTEWCTFAPTGEQALFDQAVRDTVNYHVSMLSSTVPLYENSATMPAAIYDLWAKANKFGGYRYAMTSAVLPATATAGTAVPLQVRWANFGSAPSYDNWVIRYELRDRSGASRQAVNSQLSLKSLAATQNYTATTQEPASVTADDSVSLPTTGLPAGIYAVVARVMWNEHKSSGTNALTMEPMNLAQAGRDSSGAYPIGSISLS